MESRKLFEALVQENAQSLLIFLRSTVRGEALVDELFQETLVLAWRNLDHFDQTRSFGRWIRGIARNVVRSHARSGGRYVLLSDAELMDLVDSHCESLQRLRNDTLDEKLSRLRACVEALPPRYRQAVHLRYREEVRGRSLAERLETSWENTKKLLQRGRKLLFDCMQRKWSTAEEAL